MTSAAATATLPIPAAHGSRAAARGVALRAQAPTARARLRLEPASGPRPAPERGVRDLDLLALAIKTALERVAVPIGRAAASFIRDRGWEVFGYARLRDHARERFGRTGQWLRDQAALGQAFERWPALVQALGGDDGGSPLGKVACGLVGKVATAESLAAWIELARRVTVRELRQAVSRARAAGSSWPAEEPHACGSACGLSPGIDPANEPSAVAAKTPLGAQREAAPDGDEDEERVLVRLAVPAPLRAAFDETLVLFRSVSGHEATVVSFVEALVAEAHAGLSPPDVDVIPLHSSLLDEALVEAALARSTGLWASLKQRGEPGSACALAAAVLGQLAEVARSAGQGDAAAVDAQIRTLLGLEDRLERQLGRLLRELGERGGWAQLRFASVHHYGEERLGLSRTAVQGRMRLARALSGLPLLREAYEAGRIGLESTLLVLQILGRAAADPEIERAWVVRAAEATVKRMRDEARALGRERADREAAAKPGSCASSGTIGGCSCGVGAAKPPTTAPAPLDDAAWHRSLFQPPGLLRERVWRLGGQAAAASGGSDVLLRLRLPQDLAHGFRAAIESARRQLAAEVGQVRWDQPWPDSQARPSVQAARHHDERCRRVPAWVGLLALLEEFVDTWDRPEAVPRRGAANLVYAREGWRCAAPGCTSRAQLEEHHVVYRSRGGSKTGLFNRTCACRFHHQRGEHGGLAACRGKAPLGLLWRLGRPELGLWFRNERRLPCGGSRC